MMYAIVNIPDSMYRITSTIAKNCKEYQIAYLNIGSQFSLISHPLWEIIFASPEKDVLLYIPCEISTQ